MKEVCLIDDDVFFNKTLKNLLERNDYKVASFFSSAAFFEYFENNKEVDLVITDYRLPKSDGLEIIKGIKKIRPITPAILITNYSDVQTAVKSIKLGAFEFVSKPINPSEFLKVVQQAIKANEKPSVKKPEKSNFLKGETINDIWKQIDVVAPTNLSVLITGESGTGKEVIAKYIHQHSKRKKGEFVAVDCGALPEETVLSELFGHEKGAFTGATQRKIGQFEFANGGTIFLDEIGNLPYNSQIKLLRAIQEKKIRRLGSNTDIDIDVRIIVATNENLEESIGKNKFRLDLFYRLNEFPVDLPPLRHRQEDLDMFISFFGAQAANELDMEFKEIENELLQDFHNYAWPGNLRELKNYIKRGVLLSSDGIIKKTDLGGFRLQPQKQQSNSIHSSLNLKASNKELEVNLIKEALARNKYNKSNTAKELGISRVSLYKKLEEYGIE